MEAGNQIEPLHFTLCKARRSAELAGPRRRKGTAIPLTISKNGKDECPPRFFDIIGVILYVK
jgi:hypothetical protein